MTLSRISFVMRRVLASLRDLFWTHFLTAGTMAMTLFVFGGFLLLQENLARLFSGWSNQFQIFAYLDDGVKESELANIRKRLKSYPEVESVRFVSKKEAWADFKKGLGTQSGVLEGLNEGLLPSSLEITVAPEYRDRTKVEYLANRLKEERGIAGVEFPEEWIEKLSLLLLAIQWTKWIFGGFLFMATLLIVGSTVKLAIMARKDEIEIMQLVGAPESMIKAPFVIEGMIQGLVGASFSILFLWLLLLMLGTRVPSSLGIFFPTGQLLFLNTWQVVYVFALGWLLGGAGTLVSLRRFLSA